MHNTIQAIPPIIITSGATGLILIGNAYIFYFVLFCFAAACISTCVSIINKCNARNQRLEQLKTRRLRRAHASSEHPDSN